MRGLDGLLPDGPLAPPPGLVPEADGVPGAAAPPLRAPETSAVPASLPPVAAPKAPVAVPSTQALAPATAPVRDGIVAPANRAAAELAEPAVAPARPVAQEAMREAVPVEAAGCQGLGSAFRSLRAAGLGGQAAAQCRAGDGNAEHPRATDAFAPAPHGDEVAAFGADAPGQGAEVRPWPSLVLASPGAAASPVAPVPRDQPLGLAQAGATPLAPPDAGPVLLAATLLGLAVALYRRLTAVHAHRLEARAKVFDAVRRQPGLAVADLASATGLHATTVRYHLRVLEDFHAVVLQRDGAHLRAFENGGTFDARQRARRAAEVRPGNARILEALPPEGSSPADLARRAGVSRQAVHKQLPRLVAAGLVSLEARGAGRLVRRLPQHAP